MTERIIISRHLDDFREYLLREEKSTVTIEKYCRDARTFAEFAQEKEVTKELTIAYKKSLEEHQYSIRSINSMLASLNSMLEYLGWTDCKVKMLRCQRQTYCTEV